MVPFADLGVSEAVSEALTRRGIAEPFPVQGRAIPDAMAGRDVLVRSADRIGQDARIRHPGRRAAGSQRAPPHPAR